MDPEENLPRPAALGKASRLLTKALWCAVVPLSLGILLCAGWWWSRSLTCAAGGVVVLFAGVVAFLVGLYLVRKARRIARDSPVSPDERLQRKLTWATFLLFGNFPAAAACILFAFQFRESVILIRNQTGGTLRQIEISDRYSGLSIHLENLPPGEVRRIPRFHPGDRPAHFKADLNGLAIDTELHSFDSGLGRFETRIFPDGHAEHDR